MTGALPIFLLFLLSKTEPKAKGAKASPWPKAKETPRPTGRARPTKPPGAPSDYAPASAPATGRPAAITPAVASPRPVGVPPFPGPEWVPDVPVGPGVPQRALELLPALWQAGEGASRIEQTAGRWIAYRASAMPEGKRGVVAFKLADPMVAPPPASVPSSAASPAVPASTRASVSTNLPTLRRGSKGNDVRVVQRRLGITDDGDFGPATERAVRAFQSRKGLATDGVVGPNTWAALFGSGTMA